MRRPVVPLSSLTKASPKADPTSSTPTRRERPTRVPEYRRAAANSRFRGSSAICVFSSSNAASVAAALALSL